MIARRRLTTGGRVALVAPAGPLNGEHELQRAIANVQSFGFVPVSGRHVQSRDGYLAGNDSDRLRDLEWAIADDDIDGIWCLRGGYGAMRLLRGLDIDTIAGAAKPIIGYSDVTALHALWQKAGVPSYHGPTARATLTDFSRDYLHRALFADEIQLSAADATVLSGGRVTGVLAGGNLSLLSSLCGTPYMPEFRDAIVVIEDIGEASYRIDRMLTQLLLAGAFDDCRALLFGHFTNCSEGTEDGSRRIIDILYEVAHECGVPSLYQVPVGHIDDQWTIPLGITGTLDADGQSLVIHTTG